jgi:hypothetical protein
MDASSGRSNGAGPQNLAPGVICEAIRKRTLLEFEYKGLRRVVQPYCHGISTRGMESLRAVQVRGSSSSGRFGQGKFWTVSEIVNPRLLDETFVPDDPGYNPNDSGMKYIHCRI